MTHIRRYDAVTDLADVQRIWREVGWTEGTDEQAELIGTMFSYGDALVAIVDGAAECSAHRTPGTMNHTGTDLPLCAVTAITTSRVARRTGLASTMTAMLLADAAAQGAAVAALGIFDQGFYDRHGFGTGAYDTKMVFDPSSLRVDVPYRNPIRLTKDDYVQVAAALRARRPSHGAVVLTPPEVMAVELGWETNTWALGYRDDYGTLTHFMGGVAKDEHGPYTVKWYAWQTPHQLLELLRMLAELGDQVDAMSMVEPPEIQLQDLLVRPFRSRRASKGHEHAAFAWHQFRILDLDTCIGAYASPIPTLRCNLTLTDPIASIEGAGWSGLGGDYTLTIGANSEITPGHTAGLASLSSSINAFSRLWFGVRSASQLAITTDLDGPAELLAALDQALRMPTPHTGLDF